MVSTPERQTADSGRRIFRVEWGSYFVPPHQTERRADARCSVVKDLAVSGRSNPAVKHHLSHSFPRIDTPRGPVATMPPCRGGDARSNRAGETRDGR
jgi:hypothetical protein